MTTLPFVLIEAGVILALLALLCVGGRGRHCPHVRCRGIYGDEILMHPRRLWRRVCEDCGRYLYGPPPPLTERTPSHPPATHEGGTP